MTRATSTAPTSVHRDLLRRVGEQIGGLIAGGILSDEGIDRVVATPGSGSFGAGETWGRYHLALDGIACTPQVNGLPSNTVLVPWSAVRGIRDAAAPDDLDRLRDALEFANSGPRYRRHTLPSHLFPENRDPAMTDQEWTAAVNAVHAQWKREHNEPYLAYSAKAHDLVQRALATVLDPPIPDLLDLLSRMDSEVEA
jgi:hypothetical protein